MELHLCYISTLNVMCKLSTVILCMIINVTDLFFNLLCIYLFLTWVPTIDMTHYMGQRSKLHQSKGLTEGLISPNLSVII